MSSLPTTVAAITPEFLTDALRASGFLDAGTKVDAVQPDPMAAGVGFMGEVGALDVTYSAATAAPSRLVAKIPTQDEFVRGLLAPARVFERESCFYREVAPVLDGLVPQPYFVGTEGDDHLLLLEDLGSWRCGDQLVGCTVDDAAAAITTVARFHARYWEKPALDALAWMPRMDDPGMKIGQVIYESSLPGFLAVFEDALDPGCQGIVEGFGANVPQLLDRLAAMPNTISHFDFRLDNLFFGADGAVRMIDFQTSSKGGGVYDCAYLLSQSMAVEDRRAHEDDLLRLYHDELVAGGVTGYGLDQVRADYRVGVLYSWVIPVFAVGSLDTSSERAMELWRTVIARSQTAMLDHGVSDLLST